MASRKTREGGYRLVKTRFINKIKWLKKKILDYKLLLIYSNVGVSAFSGFFYAAIGVATLGAAEYGYFAFVFAGATFLINIVGARTNEAIVYFSGNGADSVDVLRQGMLIDFILSMVYLGLGIATFLALPEEMLAHSERNFVCYALVVYGAISLLGGCPQGYLISIEKLHLASAVFLLSSVLRVIYITYVLLFENLSVRSLAFGYLLSALPIFLLFLFFMGYAIVKGEKSITFIPGFMKYSLKTYTSSLFKAGNKKVDTLILGAMVSNEMVGIYDLTKKISGPVQVIISPLADLKIKDFVVLINKKMFKEVYKRIALINRFIITTQLGWLVAVAVAVVIYRLVFSKGDIEIIIALLFFFSYLAESLKQLTWWGRPFSSAFDPIYSVWANAICMICYVLICVPLTYLWEIEGFILSILSIALIQYLFWKVLITKKIKYAKSHS